MFITAGEQRLHVVSVGAGPQTIVAHGGWVGNWEMWLPPFELLSTGWRCVAYDHRGCGESPTVPAEITPESFVDDLFGVLDALGIERCVLAAESLGCVVALDAARRDPGRFTGLVLVDGSGGVTEAVRPLITGARTDYPATVRAFVDRCVPEPDNEHIRRWGRDMLMRAEPEAAARIFECYLDPPRPPVAVAGIEIPALVVHGTADQIVPPAAGQWLAQNLPDATLLLLDGAGHVPTMTRPREVAEAIDQRFGPSRYAGSPAAAAGRPALVEGV
ncbi:MAG TPA: alpha/beta hydrolase [Micromonosporaceae bacterium]